MNFVRCIPWLLVATPVVAAAAEPVGEDRDPACSSVPCPLIPKSPIHEPTAGDVAGAPVPGDESGRVDSEGGDSTMRLLGRGVLFLPRVAVQIAFSPVRAGVWSYERYHLKERTLDIFFNDQRTIGLYPTAQLEAGFGLNVGGRFIDRDLFGASEHLSLHAGTGGRFSEIFSAKLRSGDRLGDRFALELEGQYEKRPKDAFYGIGNTAGAFVQVPEVGIETRYRETFARAAAIGDVQLLANLHVRGSGALADFKFDRSDHGPPIDDVYPMETMVGFDGFRHGYTELELRWDTRRRGSRWEPPAVHSDGWLASGFAGRMMAVGSGADYWRYGIDFQHFIRIADGPRVLAVRLAGEGVTGTLDEVPFTQLPRLGGKTLLRGYPLDRFRDRVAAVGTLEYSWDLSPHLSASTFVDAGRVFPSLRDLDVDGMRVGYGVALEAHQPRSFLVRAMVSSSIDGGVFLDLAFDPVWDLDPRVERR